MLFYIVLSLVYRISFFSKTLAIKSKPPAGSTKVPGSSRNSSSMVLVVFLGQHSYWGSKNGWNYNIEYIVHNM